MRASGLAVLAVAFTVSACSDDGEVASSCGDLQPCGGDLVGTWVPNGSCVNTGSIQTQYMNLLGGECPSGTALSVVNATSNWAKVSSTFNDDGSYAGTSTFSASIQLLVPNACLVTRGCADLDADLRATVDPAKGIVAASCLNAETACSCSITQSRPTINEAGTYSVSGTTLTLTPTGGTPEDVPYCVSDGELHLIRIDSGGAIASDIVLVKR
jgi:hypothetical protein